MSGNYVLLMVTKSLGTQTIIFRPKHSELSSNGTLQILWNYVPSWIIYEWMGNEVT